MTTESTRVLTPVGQGSLTEQATQALLDAILDDGFPGGRLPPEPALAATLNVSRTTVRAALQSLERLGVISRTPGRGTLVLPHVGRHSIALQRLIGFRSLLEERHDEVVVEQSSWTEDTLTPAAAEALGDLEGRVVRTSKRYVADGRPVIHIADEIPLEHFPADLRDALLTEEEVPLIDSIFVLSQTWPGKEIHHTVVELVSAAVAEGEDSPLDLEPGTPYLTLFETHYTVLGEPVAFSTVLVDDRTVRLQVVRHL
jgi:DNA-binding GntR family transcriptional regulator